jgi:SAM-dependent methyltransferase
MALPSDWVGYTLRYEVTKDHFRGSGLEIGAGGNPQRLPDGATCAYFDVRNADELRDLFQTEIDYPVRPLTEAPLAFPGGADFLIAHNVLEHSPDPIGALRQWHRLVRDGGAVILSIPDGTRVLETDGLRVLAPFSHVLADHILGRTDRSFESKEHVHSFILGWWRSFPQCATPQALAEHTLSEGRRDGHDFHWHSMDQPTWDKVLAAACWFDGDELQMKATTNPDHPTHPTGGEIIYCYELRKSAARDDAEPPELICEDIKYMTANLNRGLRALGRESAQSEGQPRSLATFGTDTTEVRRDSPRLLRSLRKRVRSLLARDLMTHTR